MTAGFLLELADRPRRSGRRPGRRVLSAKTSGCAFASSTVSGSSGQPGRQRRVAGLLEDARPSGPSCSAAARARGRRRPASAPTRSPARPARPRDRQERHLSSFGVAGSLTLPSRREGRQPRGQVLEPGQGVLPGARPDEGRPRALLPRRRAVSAPPRPQPADADAPLPGRRRRLSLLPGGKGNAEGTLFCRYRRSRCPVQHHHRDR